MFSDYPPMVSVELGQLESKEQRLVRQIVIHFYFSALFHLPQSMERLRINSLVVTAAEDLAHHPAATKLKIIFAVIDNFCIVLVAVLLGLVSVLALRRNLDHQDYSSFKGWRLHTAGSSLSLSVGTKVIARTADNGNYSDRWTSTIIDKTSWVDTKQ